MVTQDIDANRRGKRLNFQCKQCVLEFFVLQLGTHKINNSAGPAGRWQSRRKEKEMARF